MMEKHKSLYYNCSFYDKRQILLDVLKNENTTILLDWLKSSNVSLQLYAIEGIFILAENGIEFPSNTWDLIQIVQKKNGEILLAKICTLEMISIDILVQQIKGKYRKGKRKVNRKSKS